MCSIRFRDAYSVIILTFLLLAVSADKRPLCLTQQRCRNGRLTDPVNCLYQLSGPRGVHTPHPYPIRDRQPPSYSRVPVHTRSTREIVHEVPTHTRSPWNKHHRV